MRDPWFAREEPRDRPAVRPLCPPYTDNGTAGHRAARHPLGQTQLSEGPGQDAAR
jgi:hypothetical protein